MNCWRTQKNLFERHRNDIRFWVALGYRRNVRRKNVSQFCGIMYHSLSIRWWKDIILQIGMSLLHLMIFSFVYAKTIYHITGLIFFVLEEITIFINEKSLYYFSLSWPELYICTGSRISLLLYQRCRYTVTKHTLHAIPIAISTNYVWSVHCT